MAKFCSKCGKEIQEGVKFCPGCGAPIQGAPIQNASGQSIGAGGGYSGPQGMSGGAVGSMSTPGGMPVAARKQSNQLWLIIGAGVIVVIVVLFAAVKLIGGGGYMKPIKNLEKGFNKQDVKLISKAFVGGDDIPVEIFDSFEQMAGMLDYEIKLDVVDKEKIDKDEIEEVLTEDYYVDEIYAKNAKAAYILEIDMSITMGEYSEEETEEIPVAKIDGKWVIPENFSSLF